MKSVKIFSIWLLGSAISFAIGAPAASDSWHTTPVFHGSTPAGYEVLMVKPGGAVVSLLGLIECPELEGAQQTASGVNAGIVNVDGEPIRHFPRNFSFRITASLRKTVLVDPTDTVNIAERPEDLLLKLKFRLKAYHGLEVREIQPESVQIIGVPADIASDERIYRVSFDVEKLPITDRCVLEVLSPAGGRLAKFHFDLL
ncbi:MAG TPA: hypothetical protein VI685_08575 [Candidatus Angelobacter sp.]